MHWDTRIFEYFDGHQYEVLYLPPYSPFLNPIVNMFSKWKEIIKRTNLQNEEALIQTIRNGANMITASDCEGFIRHMHSYIPKCLNEEKLWSVCDTIWYWSLHFYLRRYFVISLYEHVIFRYRTEAVRLCGFGGQDLL